MSAQPKCVCSISNQAELCVETPRQEMLSPACIVEAELVTAASYKKLGCPAIAHKLALHIAMSPQDHTGLKHASILWISFSSVPCNLLLNDFS